MKIRKTILLFFRDELVTHRPEYFTKEVLGCVINRVSDVSEEIRGLAIETLCKRFFSTFEVGDTKKKLLIKKKNFIDE